MGKDVIIACDFPSVKATMDFLKLFNEEKPFVKIGMELFYSEGPDIVKEIKKRGHKVFLDLKLHDIPNTVGNAMKVLSSLNVDMCNVHAAGGSIMMKKALEGFNSQKNGVLIGVTQLTSTSNDLMNQEILIPGKTEDVVLSYAENVKNSGLAGVVCSPLEAPIIHDKLGRDFITVTPGIRFADDAKSDQVRVTTPKKAKELGSDYIVVGRSITKAENPVAAYRKCMADFIG